MASNLVLVVIAVACLSTSQGLSKFKQAQCGASFVKALYQACAVAKRSFDPEADEQEAKEIASRGNGGKFGSFGGKGYGGGGSFRSIGDQNKISPEARFMSTHGGEVPHSDITSQIDSAVWAYIDQFLGSFPDNKRRIIEPSSRVARGNTATNLLADFCCKHGCNWETFVGLCK